MENKTCKYLKCGKEFTPNHGKQLYCSPNCKAYDFVKNKQVKKVVLVEAEDGKFLFMNPDGSTRKCTLVWEDEQSMIYGVKTEKKCDTIRIKIKTVKDQEVPEKFKVEPEGMDLLRGFEKPAPYNFGDAKYLIIENFTKFPLKDKPSNKVDAMKWAKDKAAADAEIKSAWEQRKIQV